MRCEKEVIVIRNVGGNGIAALSDIVGLDNLVTLSDVMIIKHTGMQHLVAGQSAWVSDPIREKCSPV